jgi:hypothetical protein
MDKIRRDIYETAARQPVSNNMKLGMYLALLAEQLDLFNRYNHIQSREHPGWYEYTIDPSTATGRRELQNGPIQFVHIELSEIDRQYLSKFRPNYLNGNLERLWFVPSNPWDLQLNWIRLFPPSLSLKFEHNWPIPVGLLYQYGG